MPHPKDVQPDPRSGSDDSLLDISSLNTVLDMLMVIDSAEELALLEMLTPAQKRQVWDATPDDLKIRLKQIRSANPGENPSLNPALKVDSREQDSAAAITPECLEPQALADSPSEHDELGEAITLTESILLQAELQAVAQSTLQNSLKVGDRIVLLAQPQLTAAEMRAIWDVVEVQSEHAQIKTTRLGMRRYPLHWMAVYPE
ncbi:MAG: hypothetical protein HC772_16425 [Leptolyngbyaceae cyanobacterium CRU_2_3]|nr:hypothetical protein [Leptolyngbyaceae cyanobacterium CRU_2_3]